ncbi:enoyl-CoA hydratase/isomerase family protein [Trinickia violacea]|uniref:Enoyl-CoA hydratase/isomerase family protein n=1 Tax=Trinickia violacea TaxID=2571746 RepID=A0A4P8IUL6_9BURK|nr:enoyl-CoA hydratase/isomerase family protein [Trinickia violacea]QCP52061.1 enoyl-CoA hydratase/isomerase family protein [Trinickia violacea]
MQTNITLTSRDDLAVITLGNEAQANSIDLEFCEGLLRALGDVEANERYRAVVLQATGRIFSAGGNLVQILDGLQRADGFLETLISALNAVILKLRRLPVPVIASVQGAAAGAGFSLAMACDLVVASHSARFVVGYGKLGTSTDGGLSFHLARRLGAARALQLLLVKDSLNAEEASSLGLVQDVADPASLEEATFAIARQVANLPPSAVSEMKSLVGKASEHGLEQHLEDEKQAFLRCASTEAFYQRVAAFVGRSDSTRHSPT